MMLCADAVLLSGRMVLQTNGTPINAIRKKSLLQPLGSAVVVRKHHQH